MTAREGIQLLRERMNDAVIGQKHIVDRFIIGLLADGNLLVEGLPGLAKTRIVRSMANVIDAKFSRIQFTPDLSPSDIIGEERLYEENGKKHFRFHRGPIFGNIILADEINRAPAKVQSAMLEAMEEHQVTVAGQTIRLPQLFIVMATQNPIEQEGTYPLSEAQKDRFLMHVEIGYVDMESEFKILKLVQEEKYHSSVVKEKLPQELIFAAQKEVARVKVDDALGHYIVELVFATRYPMRYSKQLSVMIEIGVSPRGSIALQKCAKAHAWLQGRDEVDIKDVQAVIHDVFRHRMIASEHSQVNKRTKDDIVNIILEQVPIPEGFEPDEREKMLNKAKR
ncbi:AAA family ATPase [Sulfurovum sp. ST-21]|uniref:MoxR family ATPase n=1 Tax=Sulfurovum indicum TaxID=2779528 RepID=A0A7M1S2R0_9BACT|nr:MoxR family ATPase [Sulfurovum indicum]QOR61291.1 MoxR family ATPase [Sulfurovum indicum]